MNNSEELEKSKGVLLFAYNTSDVDYVKMAEQCARLVKKFMNLPVALCTDVQPDKTDVFDYVIIRSNDFKNTRFNMMGAGTVWRNGGRHAAYDVSPFDITLLIDTDTLILDNTLLKIMETVQDYQIISRNCYIKREERRKLGVTSIPYLWATVIVFNKSKRSQMLFELVDRIQRNYKYYTKLYNIPEFNFRNDYAFTIANNLVNGYGDSPENVIPWGITTVEYSVNKIELSEDRIIIRSNNAALIVPRHNLHILDKGYLLSEDCRRLIEELVK